MSVFIFSFRAVIKRDKTKAPRQSSFELMHRLKSHKRFTQLADSNHSSVANPEKVERSNCKQSFAYEKYWTTPLNLWIRIFALLQVYKMMDVAMQCAFTSIYKIMGCSKELTEFVTVTGCHHCNKSFMQISSLLNSPWSALSGKWKHCGTTAHQPCA